MMLVLNVLLPLRQLLRTCPILFSYCLNPQHLSKSGASVLICAWGFNMKAC